MKPIEAYKKFLLKVNKNDTNTNISVPVSEFVLLFNEQKRQWFSDVLDKWEGSDDIDYLNCLLEIDKPLEKISSTSLKDEYALPNNFYNQVSSYIVASKGSCSSVLYNWFIKPNDLNVYLQNENLNPSFEYQETISILSQNKLYIYKKDFTINEVYLSYYREPKDLDIEGYIHIDGSKSTNIECDMDDFLIEEVINRTALEVVRNYESAEQTQLAVSRMQSNELTIN